MDCPKNLCGWSKFRKFIFPVAWCEAENAARNFWYEKQVFEAKVQGKTPPYHPGRLSMR